MKNKSKTPTKKLYKNSNNLKKTNKINKDADYIPCVRMYEEFMEHKYNKEKEIEEIKKKELEMAEKELSFIPKINKYSQNLIKRDTVSKNKIEDKLLEYGNLYNERLLQQKKNLELNEEKIDPRPKLTKETEFLGEIKRKKREENLQNYTILINPEYLVKLEHKRNKTDSPKLKNYNKKSDLLLKNKKNKKFYKTLYKPTHPVTRKTTKIYGRKIPIPQLTPDKNLFDYLYIESKLLSEKRKKEIEKNMKENCPFKPIINSKSFDNSNSNKRSLNNNLNNRMSVFSRLYSRSPDSKIKMKNRKSLRDSITGQILFKPIITKGNLNFGSKRILTNDISNNNYLNGVKEKARDYEKNENKKKKINKEIFLEKSKEIISKAKDNRYIELFNELDSDGDGLISYKKIRLSFLDNKILIALRPIFYEMQYEGTKMDLNLFSKKIDGIVEFQNLIRNE